MHMFIHKEQTWLIKESSLNISVTKLELLQNIFIFNNIFNNTGTNVSNCLYFNTR